MTKDKNKEEVIIQIRVKKEGFDFPTLDHLMVFEQGLAEYIENSCGTCVGDISYKESNQ